MSALSYATAYGPSAEEKLEFDSLYQKAASENQAYADAGLSIEWYPQGTQQDFLSCYGIKEVLIHGPRGTGKTDLMLMTFASEIGKGHGSAWRGVIFRQSYPQLGDLISKSERWFSQIWPEANFNKAEHVWRWPTGEELMFRHMAKVADYWKYHGNELPFIGFEELTTWPSEDFYLPILTCCRSSKVGMPRWLRANTNPYGPGHSWVQSRFNLYKEWWKTKVIHGDDHVRAALHSRLSENKKLLEADPNYQSTIRAASVSQSMLKAWLEGDWNIVAGGIFSDSFSYDHNVVDEFQVPEGWFINRSFDWGGVKPFAVLWWAQSDGSDYVTKNGQRVPTVRGDLFLINEWYGWSGTPNVGINLDSSDITKGIVSRELYWKLHGRCKPGPADTQIYTVTDGQSIAKTMSREVIVNNRSYNGIRWHQADKRKDSRHQGWQRMRDLFKAGHPARNGFLREFPGLFVVGENCPQFMRTVPPLPRSEIDLDDIDKNSEDHIADACRYRVWRGDRRVKQGRTVGMW